ncbi:sensor histidine kinase [Ectothiorhodospiraceae bacterium BW-2]|nr:sensor histidine kinase [Ectothiorhodospiraceae bacterium BW-2]
MKRQNDVFPAILASSVHDMKNSLGMVLSSIDTLVERRTPDGCYPITEREIATLRYEAARVNDNLMQLLSLYRIENGHYRPVINEIYVADFLDECLAENDTIIRSYNISARLDCDEELNWYFDPMLISGVINNVFTNALRYTRTQVVLSAAMEGERLRLRIEDDGNGFPPAMLAINDSQGQTAIDFYSGNTGLGLYFSSIVAELHRNGSRVGEIRLSNGGPLGGGCFDILLP